MRVKNLRPVLVAGVCALALTGCTGSNDPGPTIAPPTTVPAPTIPAPTTPGDEPTTPDAAPTTNAPEVDASRWCAYGDADEGDVEVTFGKISAASDEWASSIDRTWRHYVPVTVTNRMEVPCIFDMWLDGAVEGGRTANEDLTVPLLPGESYSFQAFDLEEMVEFTADSKEAKPAAQVTPSVNLVTRDPYLDYYDLTTEVGKVEGKGGDATLPVTLTLNGLKPGMPERTGLSKDDLFVLGLDADGTVVTKASATIDPFTLGETRTIDLQVGGGSSSGDVRNQMPVATYDDVVTWHVALQPSSTKLKDR